MTSSDLSQPLATDVLVAGAGPAGSAAAGLLRSSSQARRNVAAPGAPASSSTRLPMRYCSSAS